MRSVRCLLPLSILVVLFAVPASAAASTTLGQLLPPYAAGSCGGSGVVQTAVEPGTNSYAVPAGGGVITSWQTQTGLNSGTMKLKVFRPTGNAGEYFIVGEEGPHNIAANTSPTFSSGVRIPVQAGDLLGMVGVGVNCTSYQPGKSGYHLSAYDIGVDPAVGTTATVFSGGTQDAIEMQATVEPDADHDGYGDETQDQCPANPKAQVPPCAPPPQLFVTLGARPKQAALKAGGVIVTASANKAVTFKATGSVSTGGQTFSLTPTTADAAAGVKTRLKLGMAKSLKNKIKQALKAGTLVRASVHVNAKDADGNPINVTHGVTIVKPAKKRHHA